ELNTLANRVQHWKNSIHMIIESSDKSTDYNKMSMLRPFIGYGPETFIVTYQSYYPKKLDTFMTNSGMLLDRPHNHYIYIVASMGLLGLLGFLSIVIVFFYLAYILLKRINTSNERFLIVGLVASMAGYLIDSIFNPSTLLTELIFWLALGLIIGIERFSFASLNDRLVTPDDEISKLKTWPGQRYRMIRYYGAACAAIALIVIGGIITVRPFLADIHLQRGLGFRASNIQNSLNEFDKALDLQPREAAYWGYLGEYSYFIARNFGDTTIKKGFLTLSTDSYEQARDLEPYLAYRYYTLADIYLYEAKEGNSERWPVVFTDYDKALRLFPDNAVILNKSVLASYINDDIDDAWDKLDVSAALDPNWSETVYLSSLLLISEDEGAVAMRKIDDEINSLQGARYYQKLNYFSQFCQRLANYGVLTQLHRTAATYVEEMPDKWTPHAIYAFTSFYSGEPLTSVDEFDYAMSIVPDDEAGNLFRAIYQLTEIAPGYGVMIADIAAGWRDKLERTADSEYVLVRLDSLLLNHVSE
ncbi:MAG: O-antigen ligase family protein, partial [Dehalococcoidia bacterium]